MTTKQEWLRVTTLRTHRRVDATALRFRRARIAWTPAGASCVRVPTIVVSSAVAASLGSVCTRMLRHADDMVGGQRTLQFRIRHHAALPPGGSTWYVVVTHDRREGGGAACKKRYPLGACSYPKAVHLPTSCAPPPLLVL